MHEYAVASNIVDLVLEHSRGKRLEKVNLAIGAMSGIFDESLKMYLELILEEKGQTNVGLVARFIPATFHCACGKEYEAEKMTDACPACGNYDRKLIAGKDCTVESIEVSDD